MADAATARREARRRRVLENSHNRLQLISGKIEDEFCKDSPRRTPVPEQTVDVPIITEVNAIDTCFLNNGMLNRDLETLGFIQENETNNREVTNDLAAFLSSASEITPSEDPSVLQKLVNYKYDIVLLSFLMQILYGLSLFRIDISYFFLPLFLFILTKLLFFPKQNKSNIANALLLLNGISTEKIENFLYIFQLLTLISQEVCIYLFITVCIQSICFIVKNILST